MPKTRSVDSSVLLGCGQHWDRRSW